MNDETIKEKDQTPPQKAGGEKEPGDEMEKLKKQRDEYLAGWQRAKADFINYKKDEMARLQDVARYGSEELVEEMISVLDSFDLAISYTERQNPAPTLQSEPRHEGVGVEKGIYMIRSQIEDTLKKRGLERIRVKKGDAFDPSTMESIKEVESGEPPGTIVEEVEPGYRLYDKILRPARVKVAKQK
ncbi:MAG: nucleotide exchange factor GrpE [Candidatus Liptonbacteria bacterium]|nr:nucleotide exchange factor GrpE [Candidatus Liptonbacteria bacterium]